MSPCFIPLGAPSDSVLVTRLWCRPTGRGHSDELVRQQSLCM